MMKSAPMSAANKKYTLQTVIGSAVFNALMGALFAAFIFRNQDFVPLYGQFSIVGDTFGTALLLTVLSVFYLNFVTKRHLKHTRLSAEKGSSTTRVWLRNHFWAFVIAATVMTVIFSTAIIIGLFSLLQVSELAYWTFVLYKACLGAVLASFVSYAACVVGLAGRP